MLSTKRTWKRIGLGFLALLTVIVGFLFGEWHYTHGRGLKRLHELEAKLDADDPGWRWDDIVAEHHRKYPPEEQSAMEMADWLRGRIKTYHTFPFEDHINTDIAAVPTNKLQLAHYPGPITTKERSIRRSELMNEFGIAHKILDDLSGAPRLKFRDYDVGHIEPLDAYSIQCGMLVLYFETRGYIDDGKSDLAIANIMGIIDLGNYSLRGHHIHYQANYKRAAAYSCELLERILARDAKVASLDKLLVRINEYRANHTILPHIHTERGRVHELFAAVEANQLPPIAILYEDARAFDDAPGMFDLYQYRWMYAEKHFPDIRADSIQEFTNLIALGGPAADQFRNEFFYGTSSYPISYVKSNPFGNTRTYTTWKESVDADIACIQIMIGCELYRQAHQRWPDTLQQLKSEGIVDSIIDPKSQHEVNYHQEEYGITLTLLGKRNRDPFDYVASGPFTPEDISVILANPDLRGRPPLPEPPQVIEIYGQTSDEFIPEDQP